MIVASCISQERCGWQLQWMKLPHYVTPRVRTNEAYLALVLLSRVITRLGDFSRITPEMIENFFAVDIAYLQEFYRQINGMDDLSHVHVTCPNCNHQFEEEISLLGEL